MSSGASLGSGLVGHEIAASSKVSSLIDELANETLKLEQKIEGVRPPQTELQDAAKRFFEQVGRIRGRPLFYPFVSTGAGRGPYVEIEDGSVKLDLINGIGVNIFGHAHPQLMRAALRGALSDVAMQGNLEPGREYTEMGRLLIENASKNSRLRHAWISTCGTIANENALKIARQKRGGARKILAMADAFAGRSTMMAEITDNAAYRQGLPTYNEVLRVPFYKASDPRSAETSLNAIKKHVEQHGKDISCFMFEPMLGEGGYLNAPPSYFTPMLEFCKEQGIVVWADEIQTFMRTGQMFAFETLGFGQYVDLCTVAKTLQTGATLYTEDMNPQAGLISGTFAGASSAMAVGVEVLKMMTDGSYFGPGGKIAKIHSEFTGMLNELNTTTCKGLLRDAGGMGLMVAVTPLDGGKETVNKLLYTLFKNGLIAFSCGHDPYRLRFLIPAIMESKDIQVAKKILEKSIQELA